MSLYQYFNLSTRVEWDEPFFQEGPEFKFQACFLAIKFFGKLQELFSLICKWAQQSYKGHLAYYLLYNESC